MALASPGLTDYLSLRTQLADSLQRYDGRHHYKDLPEETFAILSQMSPETQTGIGINRPIRFPLDKDENPINSVSTLTLQSLQYWASAPETTIRESAQQKVENALRALQERFRNAFPKKALEVIASV